jgi:choline dehydrogenase
MTAFDGPLPESADVVVVGAGSAGCVVARRLADAGVNVVLLEAGPPDDEPAIHDPVRLFELWGEGPVDWGYETVPQERCDGRRIAQIRGRVLGGSSSVNGMYYVRAQPADYDTWAHLGNAGWRYEDVLPLFKRAEDFDGGASEHRGAGGPLHVLSRYELHPLVEAMMAAAAEAGVPRNPDYNSGTPDGVAPIQLNIKDGRRQSAARAYLHPVLDADNICVRTGCHASRLLFEGARCVGVEVTRGGAVERVRAEHEVVLSAGVFDSPKLLMLSGIGPAAQLASHGIDVLVDLPGVGENLQDHVFSPLVYSAARPVPPAVAGLPQFPVHMFFRSRPGLPGPDLQSLFGHLPHGYEGPEDGYTFTSMLNRPASRGTVRLASADPSAAPLIDPCYGSREADLDAIASGLEQLREVGAQAALDGWRGAELFPGPDVQSRAALREYVRRTISTIFHPACTCKMGLDELAVVDPELRVYGVERLRVADASVMPLVTSGNTHAPTVMIGERAADHIVRAVDPSPAMVEAAA